MWIYYDSSSSMARMKEAQALSPNNMVELIDTSPYGVKNRMSWRFLPAANPIVERFIARDVDSRLTPRDKATVDAWVASGKKFHIVRDHPSHSNFPMSGGMWGSVRGALPSVVALIKGGGAADAYLADMNFLTRSVWPIARQSVLQHDAFSCQAGGRYGKGYPIPRTREGGEHLGAVYLGGKMRQGDVNILLNADRPKECTPPVEYQKWAADPAGGGGAGKVSVWLPSNNGGDLCYCSSAVSLSLSLFCLSLFCLSLCCLSLTL